MKKFIASVILLIAGIIYLIWRLTISPIFLSDISTKVKNPISFNGLSIQINTNFVGGSSKSIYSVSLIPVYLAVIISLVLLFIYKLTSVNK